jgi:hypothetical protein
MEFHNSGMREHYQSPARWRGFLPAPRFGEMKPSAAFVMGQFVGTSQGRVATSESQTRQCLVIPRPGFPVLKGRWSRLHEYLGGLIYAANGVPEKYS